MSLDLTAESPVFLSSHNRQHDDYGIDSCSNESDHRYRPTAQDQADKFQARKLSDHVYVLLPEPKPHVVLVFFHGLEILMNEEDLTSAFWKTWKMKDTDDCWPETLLPKLLKTAEGVQYRARVFSVSYKGFDDLNIAVKSLISQLILSESGANVGQQDGAPVVLVGNDLGGIFIKEFVMRVQQSTIDDSSNRKKLKEFSKNLKYLHLHATQNSRSFMPLDVRIPVDTYIKELRLAKILANEKTRINQAYDTYRIAGRFLTPSRFSPLPVGVKIRRYATNFLSKLYQGVAVQDLGGLGGLDKTSVARCTRAQLEPSPKKHSSHISTTITSDAGFQLCQKLSCPVRDLADVLMEAIREESQSYSTASPVAKYKNRISSSPYPLSAHQSLRGELENSTPRTAKEDVIAQRLNPGLAVSRRFPSPTSSASPLCSQLPQGNLEILTPGPARESVTALDLRPHFGRYLSYDSYISSCKAPSMTFWRSRSSDSLIPKEILLSSAAIPQRHGTIVETSLRPDVVDKGFQQWDISFDQKRVLCIYGTDHEDKDAVAMIFFHAEGMASIFGVGLPYSKVVVKKNSHVIVKEVGESTWKGFWMASSNRFGFVLLLESMNCNSSQSQGLKSLQLSDSAKEITKLHGVGVEDICIIEQVDKVHHNVGSNENFQSHGSRAWINELYELLKMKIEEGELSTRKGTCYQEGEAPSSGSNLASTSTGQEGSNHSERSIKLNAGSSLSEGHLGSTPRSIRVDESGESSQDVLRDPNIHELTVVVYLDSSKRNFFDPIKKVLLIHSRDLDSNIESLRYPDSEEPLNILDPAIFKFEMVPTVTITFSCNMNQLGVSGSKKINTTLDVNFCIRSSIEVAERFGWYHDHLQSAFKCKKQGSVRRIYSKSQYGDVESDLDVRDVLWNRTNEISESKLQGIGQGGKVFAGSKNFGYVTMDSSSRTEDQRCNIQKDESSVKLSITYLTSTNFSVTNCGGSSEVGLRADLCPPVDSFAIVNGDVRQRTVAQKSGMMSDIHIIHKGDWIVIDECNSASESSQICEYDFSCSRNLHMLQRNDDDDESIPKEQPTMNVMERWSLSKLFWGSPSQREDIIAQGDPKELKIEEKIERVFFLNHSFCHMLARDSETILYWNMAQNPQAQDAIKKYVYCKGTS